MNNKLLSAQDIIPRASSSAACGFNSCIYGDTYREAIVDHYPDSGRMAGFLKAQELISEGKIYYIHKFRHLSLNNICEGWSFSYGGFQVCNECGRKHCDKPWWKIKVMKDGNSFCVVGEGFENLQESDNYAFGDTKEEALQNYQDIFLKKQ